MKIRNYYHLMTLMFVLLVLAILKICHLLELDIQSEHSEIPVITNHLSDMSDKNILK